MNKKVTIQDIADALGVSRNTVSKAINNSEGLAEATREKILLKAVEMGYKQFSYVYDIANAVASPGAAVGFRGEVAVLSTQLLSQSHFGSVMLDRFQRELALAGYSISIHRVMKENVSSLTLPITFMKERVVGVVCIEMFDRAYDEMVCALGIPVLFIDGPVRSGGETLPCDQVIMENATEVTRFVHLMLARGKRRFGFIGDWDHCQSFYERYAAFRMALLMEDIPVEPRFLIRSNTAEALEAALDTLTELPEVFVCANDFVAYDAIQLLRRRGLRVPRDVLFCGFDDSPESRRMSPTLTTIHIRTHIMAGSAAQMLLARIKEPNLDFRTIYTETYLIERESTEEKT